MPSELERSVRRFRTSLLDRDAESRRAIQRSYRAAIDGLQAELAAATQRIAELRATGPVPTWRVLEEQRIRQLLARAQIEFQQFADRTDLELVRAQRAAIQQAQDDARQAIVDGFGAAPAGAVLPVHLLPIQALQQLTASLQPDSPVRKLLDEFAGDARQAVEDELIKGMASGDSPSVVASSITRTLGRQHYVRARRIARTEMLRSYRESFRQTLVANSHLVRGWIWWSALDKRTCPTCYAMHGTKHPVTEPMSEHPNGRCVMMPDTKSWKELGYDVPENRPVVEPGEAVFARLSAEAQLEKLGPAAYALYAEGTIQLSDLVAVRRNRTWGTTRSRGSIAGALTRARKRERRAA